MRCEEEDCPAEATHSVTLNIPAAGVPIDCHQPMKMFIDVCLCHEHAKDYGKGFTWDENADLKDTITKFTREGNFGERDFEKTYHGVVGLNDRSYLNFQRQLMDDKKLA